MSPKVSLEATVAKDGAVVCRLDCNGQHVKITFTGKDVLVDVPEPKESP
jgi:hypothetical protein